MGPKLELYKHHREQEDVDSDDSNESRVQDRQSLPVHCIGRQHGSDVFVLGPNLQFWKTGEAVPPECQQYIWIPYVLKKLDVLPSASPLTSLPEVRHPLRKVVKGLRRISGENFGSSLLVLGEYYLLHIRTGEPCLMQILGFEHKYCACE